MSNVNPIAAQSLAHLVAHLVVNSPEPTSRSVLNRHFKTTSNIPANERLSLAILNLLEYGYLYKAFDQAASSVSYWPTQKLADFLSKPIGDFFETPEPISRTSGYPDFIGCATADLIPASTVEAPVVPAPVTTGELVQEPVDADWCPIKEFLATKYTNNVRADYRARAVLVYLAMRQHWEKTKVIDELNKLMRPYLVKRAIDTLIDKKVVEIGVLVARHGDFALLRVVDQDFVAKVHQVEPPLMHDIRMLGGPVTTTGIGSASATAPQEAPEPPDETIKVARLIAALPKGDQDLVIALVTRLAIPK